MSGIKEYLNSLKNKVMGYITQKVEDESDKYLPPTPMTPIEERRRRLIKSIYSMLSLESVKPKLRQFNSIVRAQLPRNVEPAVYEKVIEDFNNSKKHMYEFYENYRQSGEVGKKGTSLAEILGISNESLLAIYGLGNELHNQNRFSEAMIIFEVLMLLKPRVTSFWVAVGVTLDVQRRFFEAVKVYKYGKNTFPRKASFPVHLAQCYINLRENMMASIELDRAEKLLYRSEKKQARWAMALTNLKIYITT
jgi:tetratricopeptide (TPR) repeat protein